MSIPQSGYRDFNEIIQVHDRIYSENIQETKLGCEQVFSWISKIPRRQHFLEITAVVRSALIQESENKLSKSKLKQLANKFFTFFSKNISEFPNDDEYYQLFLQYAYSDGDYSPPKDELMLLCNYLLNFLDQHFWIPNIKAHQEAVKEAYLAISEYFEKETAFDISKLNFLLYFTPIFAKEFCNDVTKNKDDLIFGFSRSELITKIPKFIQNAIVFTNDTFSNSFAFEFADYLIQGSKWASNVIDMLYEKNICDKQIISNYVFCAPQKSKIATDFLQRHNFSESDELAANFWQGIPMGNLPYSWGGESELEVDPSLVGILNPGNFRIKHSNNDRNRIKFDNVNANNNNRNAINNNRNDNSNNNNNRNDNNANNSNASSNANANNTNNDRNPSRNNINITTSNRNTNSNAISPPKPANAFNPTKIPPKKKITIKKRKHTTGLLISKDKDKK